jgi:hypothetical protein
MAYTESNASIQSLRLLGQFLSRESYTLRRLWELFAGVLQEANARRVLRYDEWEQDWFIAKYGSDDFFTGVHASYAPPSDFLSFPTFDLDDHLRRMNLPGSTVSGTRSNTNPSAMFTQEPQLAVAGPLVLNDFYELRGRIRAQNDPAMAQLNQTLAWFNAGIGRLFGGVALEPSFDLDLALTVLEQRWSRVWSEEDEHGGVLGKPEFLQRKLDVFYGAEIAPDKLLIKPSLQGQPRQWQKYWQWMSREVEPGLALAATQMAARLMICPPILVFMRSKLREAAHGDVTLEHMMILVVLRRLALELQAMSWLEHALQYRFEHVRTQDLSAFAFCAIRPHWPRRLFALSHRSKDIKPALAKLAAWGDFRYSIDATFVPHWETNVAMVWGLFSAVPGLIRVASERYDDSVWCRRERELFDYLRDSDDFFHGRHVIQMDEAQLPLLDATIASDTMSISLPSLMVGKGKFPPISPVFILYPFEAWESKLLAIAAAVRLIFLKMRELELTALLCRYLAEGKLPPAEISPFTNHPDGWTSIAALFQEFQHDWGDTPTGFPLTVDAGLRSQEEMDRDLASADSLIDLSDGLVDQVAALAALEWNRTMVPSLVGNYRYGSFFAVDYRRLTEAAWRTAECMVIQGVSRVRTSVPVWILQRDDQRIDEWPGMGMNPIFTQHVVGQCDWMQGLLQEPWWPDIYRTDCKLAFSNKLIAACAATKNRNPSFNIGYSF